MQKILRRLALTLAAIAATVGLTLGGGLPAGALTLSTPINCAWLQKAKVVPWGIGSIYKVTYTAYSKTGWKLGTYSGYGNAVWSTPWEDITVWGTSADPSWGLGGTCYA